MKPLVLLRLLLLSLCSVAAISCSSFDRHWSAAAGRGADPVAGRWDGNWKSTRGTHHGRLQCVFTKVDAQHYRADFKAHWAAFTSNYTVVFDVRPHGREVEFKGSHDLGPLAGGVYKYHGVVTPDHFHASYDSSYDTGIFDLRRPLRQ